jgi:hypothetical protein
MGRTSKMSKRAPAAAPAAAAKKKAAPGVKAPPKKAPAAKKAKKGGDTDDDGGSDSDAPVAAAKAPKGGAAAAAKPRRAKEMKPVELIDTAMKAFRWWEAEPLPKGVKWRTIEHRGVCFPHAYVPHGVRMLYAGNPVGLTPEQEELATLYAGIATDGPQLGVPETAKVFNENFFRDFRELLGKEHVVQRFKDCDFEVRARARARGREGGCAGGAGPRAQSPALGARVLARMARAHLDRATHTCTLALAHTHAHTHTHTRGTPFPRQ